MIFTEWYIEKVSFDRDLYCIDSISNNNRRWAFAIKEENRKYIIVAYSHIYKYINIINHFYDLDNRISFTYIDEAKECVNKIIDKIEKLSTFE